MFEAPLCWNIATVEEFDQAARHVRPDDLRAGVLIASEPERFVEWLRDVASLGFSEIYLHHVGREQAAFLDCFGEHVLPELKGVRV